MAFRERKEDLARLISLENGKILSEARGEVQEVIDMCDFAVGQARMLYGNQMASERTAECKKAPDGRPGPCRGFG